MKRIDSSARTVRELLYDVRYSIDFYQREYAWADRQVRELVDDLVSRFMDFYNPESTLDDIRGYGQYFLGAIVINHKSGRRFIVDGQQRLTTLALLFISLHHLQAGRSDAQDIAGCIFSMAAGRVEPNLEVSERLAVIRALIEGADPDLEGQNASILNIAQQFKNIQQLFPMDLAERPLPYFVSWLCDNVNMVQIETYADEDAYSIFETMNDRGAPLRPPDLLRGYILANIESEPARVEANEVWLRHMRALSELGEEEDVGFFTAWLRAKYAQTMRPGRKGAPNEDYERIRTDFHRWLREHRDRVGLGGSADFVRFVNTELAFYARHASAIREATMTLVKGWESVFYNADRRLSLQLQVLLAPLTPGDSDETVHRKVALVADFLDIWSARRIWHFKSITYASVKYSLFILTKALRGLELSALPGVLRTRLAQQVESFATEPRFRLRPGNYRQVRHLMARFTHWVEQGCGRPSDFEALVRQERGRSFEIEHLWPDEYPAFAEHFDYPPQFEAARNHIGGLVYIHRSLSRGLTAENYRTKRHAYVATGEPLLARSLHKSSYKQEPGIQTLIDRTGLPFRPYERFGPAEQRERQALFIRMAEWIWNPSRLDLDGEKPPIHETIVGQRWLRPAFAPRLDRHLTCLRFWQTLLPVSRSRHDLHRHLKPTRSFRLGTSSRGQSWNYVLRKAEIRVEFFLESADSAVNKALFDALNLKRAAIDAAFGGSLDWDRVDDKRVCRVSAHVPGGWADETCWPDLIQRAVDAMFRLHGALARPVELLNLGEDWDW